MGTITCWWWLRSSGYSQLAAAVIYGSNGSLTDFDVTYAWGAVRPAIRVSLASPFFQQ